MAVPTRHRFEWYHRRLLAQEINRISRYFETLSEASPGDVLVVGSDGLPTISTVPTGTGNWAEITDSPFTISSQSTYDITWDQDLYLEMRFFLENFTVSTDSAQMLARLGSGDGATIYSGSSDYNQQYHNMGSTDTAYSDGSRILLSNQGNDTGEEMNGEIQVLHGYQRSGTGARVRVSTMYHVASGAQLGLEADAVLEGSSAVIDTLRLLPSSGTFSGTVRAFGRAV